MSAEGDHSSVALGVESTTNKEVLLSFAASEHHVSLLMRDKQNTPTVNGGCANLNVQSSLVSKHSVANENDGNSVKSLIRGSPAKQVPTSNII